MVAWQWYGILGVVAAFLIALPLMADRLRDLDLNKAGLGNVKTMTDEDMLQHMSRLLGALGYKVQRADEGDPIIDLILVDGLGQSRAVHVRQWRKTIDEGVIHQVAEAAQALGPGLPMIITVERFTYKARQAGTALGVILWSLAELASAIGTVRKNSVNYPGLPSQREAELLAIFEETLPVAPAAAEEGTEANPDEENPEAATAAVAASTIPTPTARRRPVRMRKGQAWSSSDTPTCPRCGRPMEIKSTSKGEHWACQSFPRCLGTRSR